MARDKERDTMYEALSAAGAGFVCLQLELKEAVDTPKNTGA
jgi:hypothetical protein